MDPQSVFESLIRLIFESTYIPAAASAVIILTALLKQFPFIRDRVSSVVIAFALQVAFWVIWQVAIRSGMTADLFGEQLDAFTTVLVGIAQFVYGTNVTHRLYESNRKAGVPLIGSPKKHSDAVG